jgi:CHAD domain-containing protein
MEFIVSGKISRKAVFAALAAHFSVRPGRPAAVMRILFDTFDWRLHAAGQRLEQIRQDGRISTRWLDNATGRLLGVMDGCAPVFARDWKPAAQGEALGRIIKMRALLPVAELETVWLPADILDELEKTVLRVAVEASTATNLTAVRLPATVHLFPVRGYHKALQQAARALGALDGIARSHCSILERALAVQGRSPGEYSSKIDVRLSPGMPAEEAVRIVLRRLLEVIEQNHYGTAADIDTEFLHDFRVAVRRTRSMLSQMEEAIPTAVLKRFRSGFDWLGAVTGPTRDFDVFLLKFDGYSADLDELTCHDLAPLRAHIVRRQCREQKALARAITSGRYRRLIENWRQALSAPWVSSSDEFRGSHSVRAVAGRRILKLYKRILRQGKALSPEAPPSAVHRLRIACKKLRYMLEFFKSLYPAADIEALIAPLKQLQDVLGDFQDYEVHRSELYDFASEMTARSRPVPRTLLAMGVLAERFTAAQSEARAYLERRFAEFSSQHTKARVLILFAPADEAITDECDRSV